MILKFENECYGEKDSWYTISGVKSFTRDIRQYRCKNGCTPPDERCDECPTWITADVELVDYHTFPQAMETYNKDKDNVLYPQKYCYRVAVDIGEEELLIIFAGFLNAFVMNDDGKTIDRF